MPEKTPTGNRNRTIVVVAIILIVIIAAIAGFIFTSKPPPPEPVAQKAPEKVRVPVKNQPLIDYQAVQKDRPAKDLMAERKAEYGLEKGLDIIAKSDETVKIGDATVSMQEIADQIRLEGGEIIEKDLGRAGGAIKVFGIHVVQPGDNIWNIHFRFLKEYFDNRNIRISPLADEPDQRGFSSGVGKLLKFSENLVYIYNIRERKIDVDLSLIHPLSKIVVYNMDQVFALLEGIDYEQVRYVRFDGENIWIPAEQ